MEKNLRVIRKLLLFFMVVLFFSGLTAIPIDYELSFLLKFFSRGNSWHIWLQKVLSAYQNVKYGTPFLIYGYDWLAFAHFILAVLFIGPYRSPVQNIWVIEFGLIACVLIFPLAFIAGHYRGIPLGWQLIDCSFGAFGLIPIWICYLKTKQIIQIKTHEN